MRLLEAKMSDKEFDIWWKTINRHFEEGEPRLIALLKTSGIFRYEIAFKGMFGLPETYFERLSQLADVVGNQEDQVFSIAQWRLIQAVLQGR